MNLNFYKQICLALLLTPFCGGLYAQSAGNITLDFRSEPLSAVLRSIERQTGKSFFYDGDLIPDVNAPVTISVRNADLETVVDLLFDKRLAVSETSQHIVLRRASADENTSAREAARGNGGRAEEQLTRPGANTRQSQATVSGTIVDADTGAPVAYASIVLKGTNRGLTSDANGRFTIAVDNAATDILIVSYVGYKTQEVRIDGRSQVEVRMATDVHAISAVDVIVTGYQTLSKERATGSFSVITGEALTHKIQPGLTSRMEGMAAGYTSYKGEIRIRGTATLQGDAAPLYVINGLPYEGSLDAINPSEIENITILKDAAAASIYGARSANGVIVITTRGGARDEKTRVEYNNSFIVTPLRDNRDYLKLMNSSELVTFQKEIFDFYHTTYNSINKKYYLNPVSQLLYDHEAGRIDDAQLENGLDIYRKLDNRDQLIDNFLRKAAFSHQHNLSIRGGSGKFTYAASMNYAQNTPDGASSGSLYGKGYNNERIGYNVKTTFDFYKWLRADFSMIGSFTNSTENLGFDAYGYLDGGQASYQMITDEQGEELKWYQFKSQPEMDRLTSRGLYDESFYPLQEYTRAKNRARTGYFNINAGINARLIDGLTLDLRYQNAKDYSHEAFTRSKDAYWVRNRVNDATQIIGGKINHLIPPGGYIEETRGDGNYYVVRGQLNFDRTFGSKHNVTAIAGAEVNAKHTTSTYIEKYGYDPQSLDSKQIDEVLLSNVQYGTEAVGGSYNHSSGSSPKNFFDIENRYVSFYGNASYTYDMRYSVTGSVKMEQSNLWGTDARNQYRPFWHVGATWKLSNENFMQDVNWVDFLSLRITQGVNGQVPKNAGPYLILVSTGLNSWTQEYSSQIQSPPNSGLKWERTDVTNIGLDFRLFGNRLRGSVD